MRLVREIRQRNSWVTKYKISQAETQDSRSYVKNKNQLDATYYFTVLLIGSTCFGHYYAHHQELTTMMLITTLVVSFCKDGRGSVNVKLWFLVVYVRCEVLCRSVVLDNVFILILIVVILCVWWSWCSLVCGSRGVPLCVVIVVFLCVWWS